MPALLTGGPSSRSALEQSCGTPFVPYRAPIGGSRLEANAAFGRRFSILVIGDQLLDGVEHDGELLIVQPLNEWI
jgi:hypothetical protein